LGFYALLTDQLNHNITKSNLNTDLLFPNYFTLCIRDNPSLSVPLYSCSRRARILL